MRKLSKFELSHVSGGASTTSRSKANNGYGNGGSDPAPGRSGKTSPGKLADVVR